MLDGGYELDIEGICENIDEASVVTLYFPMLRSTLLMDTRSGKFVRPYIGIVPMARSSSERFESLKRLRPRLPRPDSITMIPWARRVGALEEAGVWERLIARLGDRQLGGVGARGGLPRAALRPRAAGTRQRDPRPPVRDDLAQPRTRPRDGLRRSWVRPTPRTRRAPGR